jgi:hypothetical protein
LSHGARGLGGALTIPTVGHGAIMRYHQPFNSGAAH